MACQSVQADGQGCVSLMEAITDLPRNTMLVKRGLYSWDVATWTITLLAVLSTSEQLPLPQGIWAMSGPHPDCYVSPRTRLCQMSLAHSLVSEDGGPLGHFLA